MAILVSSRWFVVTNLFLPDVISLTNHKCFTCFEQFDAWVMWVPWANWQQNISCLDGSSALALTPKSNGPQDIAIIQNMATFEAHHHMFRCSGKETPKTYPPKKYVKFWQAAQHKFRCLGNLRLKTHRPSKHVKFQDLCFGVICPCSMQNLAMPYP